MPEYRLGEVEMRFASLIWEKEPIPSGELVKLCEKELNWKKSTTYTCLKRLCEKGVFKNENGVVVSVFSKEEFVAKQSEQFVEDTFKGSLPGFVAAFCSRKKLSKTEIAELKKIIEENE
ncbi:MAG: BlaI/MecI/CopY family transcriptional regulator [Roseburia sp.]|nr:BlaI/MecI/CopY family transcriptional regulator [Roseburia sp.]